ncbi:hypothetical protein [Nocardioides daphniae]|uniref:Uncharacterized protein n=1 Tax=Nocardioides daphniae TaxID=402297 RepID=A0A4P7UA02_9ACTN|nr:hypothetical protein [Nocardioides daphniae]QCC76048.1 hypothetical protein E2C04_00485 [Nocardioides daphniae]GGD10756.1 hypothetical protein GCM10007231_06910 [Nocardioides daphniae]
MTEQTQPEPTGTVITERDQRRILAAMTTMPYAASSRVPTPWSATREAVTADAIVAFLDGLAEVLADVGAENDQHRRRLFSLEADVQAFRRLIGTAPAEVTP